MGKRGPKKLRNAPPREAAMRKPRAKGSGAKPIVDGKPAAWRPTWREPKKRTLKQKQLAGLTRGEKYRALRTIVEAPMADDMAVLKAIEIDNRMQGHNEPERHDVQVSGDFWAFAERRES